MENLIAIVKNDRITDIIVASDEYASNLKDQTVNITGIDCGRGWGYKNGEFIHPDTFLSEEELRIKKTKEELEWQKQKLENVSFFAPLIDHPKHTEIMAFREKVFKYHEQEDFPFGERPSDEPLPIKEVLQ